MGEEPILSNPVKPPGNEKTIGGGGSDLPKKTLSGGSDVPPKKRRNSKGTSVEPRYGKRLMKYFPISEEELGELFGIGALATIFFSLTTGFFSFALGVLKDIDLNQPLPEKVVSNWTNISYGCLSSSVFFLIVGGLLIRWGHTKIKKIKTDTEFDGE